MDISGMTLSYHRKNMRIKSGNTHIALDSKVTRTGQAKGMDSLDD